MSEDQRHKRNNRPSPGKGGEAPPPPTDKVPDMPAEDWRNAGLHLLMLLAQTYYKLLESAIGVPCGAVDLDLNHSYLWTLKNIRNLLDNHPDLKDFPGPFEPVFPDLYPSTVRDVDWEDMVAPDAERFLSTVQEYVMSKGAYPPEERSPAWVFIELFKPGVTCAIEAGEAYRKRMNLHCQKILAQTSKPADSPDTPGNASAPKRQPMPDLSAIFGSPLDSDDTQAREEAWSVVHLSDPNFSPRTMTVNDKAFTVELGPRMRRVYNQYTDPDEFLEVCPDYAHLMDVEYVGENETLVIRVHCEPTRLPFPSSIRLDAIPDNWRTECGKYGVVTLSNGHQLPVRGYETKPTTATDESVVSMRRLNRHGGIPDGGASLQESHTSGLSSPDQVCSGTSNPPRPPGMGPQFDWVKQAELVRALNGVLGEDESPDKSVLTRAVQNGLIQTNGESGRKCLYQVDSVKAWLIKTRGMEYGEVQQVVYAIIAEIMKRTQKH